MRLLLALCVAMGFVSIAGAQSVTTGSPFIATKGGWKVDPSTRAALAPASEARVEGFLLGGQPVTLELSRFEVLAADARVVKGEAIGDVAAPRPDVQLWRGGVAGTPDSRVYIALASGTASGYIIDREHTWIISGGPTGSPIAIETFESLTRQGIKVDAPVCSGHVSIPGAPPPVMNFGSGDSPRAWTCRKIRVAIDCDYEFTQNLFGGNATNSAAYAVSLFGAISEIYQRDTNIIIEVGYLRTWTVADDPYTSANTGDQLPQFRTYWNTNMGAVQRNLAHLLSGRGLGGGIAYLNVACNSSWHYGVSANMSGFFPYPLQNHSGQNWDVMVCAHEMGHNLGTLHTHDVSQYNPPIDGCGNAYLNPPQTQDCSQSWSGTIMSYCHICPGGMTNINLTFGPRVSAAIRDYLDGAAASCGTTPALSISQQPQSQTVVPDSDAVFSVTATAPTAITYQWRRNNQNLTDSGHIIGSRAPQLVVVGVQPFDLGSYDVVLTNVCGIVTSQPATLAFTSSCYANCDGSTVAPVLSPNDFQCFINRYAAGLASANCDGSTGTPSLTANDFQCFINAFASGCP